MIQKIKFKNIDGLYKDIEQETELPNYCPICNEKMKPTDIYACFYYINKLEDYRAYVFYQCFACNDVFGVRYEQEPGSSKHDLHFIQKSIFPIASMVEPFTNEIQSYFPDFFKIYNQAYKAEQAGLNEICGLGYRKALESLVKEYVITKNLNDKDKIMNMNLSKCISEYIEDDKIKQLASASAWIGNDEAHIMKKHLDRDYNDLKKFIKAIVYYISMELTVEDAASIEPKK